MVVRVGPPATTSRKLRQTRKGAAVAAESGAGVWLARTATYLHAVRAQAQRTGVSRKANVERGLLTNPKHNIASGLLATVCKQSVDPPAIRFLSHATRA